MRPGIPADLDSLARLYDDLNDHLAASTNYPGWIKGVYPIREDAADGIDAGCLFVAMAEGKITGSIILRRSQEAAYAAGGWQAPLDDSDVLVIHTFVVAPEYLRHGVGRKMLAFAAQYAMEVNCKALRLDVYEKNLPAIALYEKCGYQYAGTVSLGLEQHGLDWFRLYEKLL